MAEEYDIGVKIGLDDEELARGPEEIFKNWQRLQQRLSQDPLFSRGQSALLKEYGEEFNRIGRMAETQGFLRPEEFRRQSQALREMGRIGKEVFRELKTEAEAAGVGGEFWSQKAAEVQEAFERIGRAPAAERPGLTEIANRKLEEYNRLAASGVNPALEDIRQQEAGFIQGLQEQEAESRLMRFRYRADTPQAAERPVIPQGPDAEAQLRAMTREVAGTEELTDSQRTLLTEYERRQEGLQKLGERQGFLTDQQVREQRRLSREQQSILKEHYDGAIEQASKGEERFSNEIESLQKERREASSEQERERITEALRISEQAYANAQATGIGPLAVRQRRDMHMALLDERQRQAQLLGLGQPEESEGQGRRGFGVGPFLSFGRGLVGGAIIGGLAYHLGSKLRQDIKEESNRQILAADLGQRLRPSGMGAQEYEALLRQLEPSLTPEESTRFAAEYTALAGAQGVLQGRGQQAVRLSRAFGFTPEQGGQLFGQAERMGIDQVRLAQTLGEQIAEAQMRGREGEAFEAIIRTSDALLQRLGTAPNVDILAGLFGRLSDTGIPGLRGAYGMQRLQGIDEAIRGTQVFPVPDMRQLGLLSMFQRMGIDNPAEMMRIQQEGIFNNPELLRQLFMQVREFGGRGEWLGAAFAQSMGVTLQPETFQALEAVAQNPERLTRLQDKLKQLVGEEEVAALQKDQSKYLKALELVRTFGTEEGPRLPAEEERQRFLAELGREAGTLAEVLDLRTTRASIAQLESFISDKMLPAYAASLNAIEFGTDGVITFGTVTKQVAQELLGLTPPGGTGPKPTPLLESPEELGLESREGVGWNALFKLGGHLWRSLREPAPEAKPGEAGTGRPTPGIPEAFEEAFRRSSAKHNVPFALLAGLAKQESQFNPNSVSPSGAVSLMQLMPSSFPHRTREELFDPEINIDEGAGYLRKLYDRFRPEAGSEAEAWRLAIAAYNWRGENSAGVRPGESIEETLRRAPSETRTHQKKVLENAARFAGTSVPEGEAETGAAKLKAEMTAAEARVRSEAEKAMQNLDRRSSREESASPLQLSALRHMSGMHVGFDPVSIIVRNENGEAMEHLQVQARLTTANYMPPTQSPNLSWA